MIWKNLCVKAKALWLKAVLTWFLHEKTLSPSVSFQRFNQKCRGLDWENFCKMCKIQHWEKIVSAFSTEILSSIQSAPKYSLHASNFRSKFSQFVTKRFAFEEIFAPDYITQVSSSFEKLDLIQENLIWRSIFDDNTYAKGKTSLSHF